jgi:Arc/MetJ-type ribon-helix-helix transcriptional regulator
MEIKLPEDLERSIRAAVDSGCYASMDDAIANAVRLVLQRPAPPDRHPFTEQELEQQLIESCFLANVPPPRDPAMPAWTFDPVKIEGEPLPETVIRERR